MVKDYAAANAMALLIRLRKYIDCVFLFPVMAAMINFKYPAFVYWEILLATRLNGSSTAFCFKMVSINQNYDFFTESLYLLYSQSHKSVEFQLN